MAIPVFAHWVFREPVWYERFQFARVITPHAAKLFTNEALATSAET